TLTIDQVGNSYRWSNGATTKSITIERSGTYIAYIGNEQGCERESEPISITINENPKPIIQVRGLLELCETDSVELYVTPLAGYTYQWSTGEEGTSIVVKDSKNVYVTSTTDQGCSSVSDITTVVVHPLPKPTIHLSGPDTICEGDSITLTVEQEA